MALMDSPRRRAMVARARAPRTPIASQMRIRNIRMDCFPRYCGQSWVWAQSASEGQACADEVGDQPQRTQRFTEETCWPAMSCQTKFMHYRYSRPIYNEGGGGGG